jgi:hypothetical protein
VSRNSGLFLKYAVTLSSVKGRRSAKKLFCRVLICQMALDKEIILPSVKCQHSTKVTAVNYIRLLIDGPLPRVAFRQVFETYQIILCRVYFYAECFILDKQCLCRESYFTECGT